MECVIPQKFHRSIMGPKGSRIQQITRDHNVQIKFPEREDPQGNGSIHAAERTCRIKSVLLCFSQTVTHRLQHLLQRLLSRRTEKLTER